MSKNYLAKPSQLRIVRSSDDDDNFINANDDSNSDFCCFTPLFQIEESNWNLELIRSEILICSLLK